MLGQGCSDCELSTWYAVCCTSVYENEAALAEERDQGFVSVGITHEPATCTPNQTAFAKRKGSICLIILAMQCFKGQQSLSSQMQSPHNTFSTVQIILQQLHRGSDSWFTSPHISPQLSRCPLMQETLSPNTQPQEKQNSK